MGVDLVLVVPENRKADRKIIDDYYNFVFNKERKLRPGITREESSYTINYKNDLAWLERKGYILIMERLSSDICNALNWQKMYELFGDPQKKHRVIYGDKIKELIKMLREAKEKLIEKEKKREGGPDWTNWEKIEPHIIGLCEFALKNGFGIELSE